MLHRNEYLLERNSISCTVVFQDECYSTHRLFALIKYKNSVVWYLCCFLVRC